MKKYQNTYCNPLPLPNYPIGRRCREYEMEDFRETADPTVIYEGGKWYMYPSCGMAYYSEDFVSWKHHKIEPFDDIGYAPTVVKHKNKFYLTACSADLWVSDSPLGPFSSLGAFTGVDGKIYRVDDPMIFSDDDSRLYLYWGCGGEGIFGVELASDEPTHFISEPKLLFSYNPDHVWERVGDWNEDASHSWIEGAYMLKRNGTYYLTYCGPGTEWVTYAMGAYTAKSPLGPFTYMESSPFIKKTAGLVKGPGHGCVVEGPENTLWAFYTCVLCYSYKLERRIGMDPLGIDEHGNLYVKHVTETPQFAPGTVAHPEEGNDAGLLPLTFHHETEASSCLPGRNPLYAVDESMLSWWQPAPGDKNPWIRVKLTETGSDISAVRLIWRDVGLDIRNGILPGAFQYTLEARSLDGEWFPVLDRSDSREDYVIDYQTFETVTASEIRLRITGSPAGIEPGLICLTVFGQWHQE